MLNITHSRRIHIGHDEEHPCMLCVTDPHLGSVDYVIVLVLFSARPQRKCITPRLCFREAEAPALSQQATSSKRVAVNSVQQIKL